MLNEERISKQLAFLTEIDKMKSIFRRNIIIDRSRPENDAEHSWHMAMTAMILYEYAYSADVDLFRVIKMALVHDLVEIYAGDTFCYDEEGNISKEEREKQAADKLFAMLPEDQGKEMRSLWEEFDAMETPDSLYAAAADRLQPLILNYNTDGYTWRSGEITSDKVYKRLEKVKTGMPELWQIVRYMLDDCIKRGVLKP